MIPFSILCVKLHMSDESVLECRVIDLAIDSFTTRVPLGYMATHGDILRLELSFFVWKKNSYETIEVDNFEVFTKALEAVCEVLRITTASKTFMEKARLLSKEYIHYIDCKMNLSDSELSKDLTGYPAELDEVYATDQASQLKEVFEDISRRLNKKAWEKLLEDNLEWGVALENRKRIEDFLCLPVSEFMERLFSQNSLEGHPLSKVRPRYVYLGNSYCTCLNPSLEISKEVFRKASLEGCRVVYVLAPVPESLYDRTLGLVNALLDLGIEEFCVNDLGVYGYINASGRAIAHKGILLCKERRDVRNRYLDDCGGQMAMKTASEVYLPFYQTNTGTFCPLYAATVNGDRGRQLRAENCNNICETKHFLYPSHLNLYGKYNSLMGLNDDLLTNAVLIADAAKALGRAVINL